MIPPDITGVLLVFVVLCFILTIALFYAICGLNRLIRRIMGIIWAIRGRLMWFY